MSEKYKNQFKINEIQKELSEVRSDLIITEFHESWWESGMIDHVGFSIPIKGNSKLIKTLCERGWKQGCKWLTLEGFYMRKMFFLIDVEE